MTHLQWPISSTSHTQSCSQHKQYHLKFSRTWAPNFFLPFEQPTFASRYGGFLRRSSVSNMCTQCDKPNDKPPNRDGLCNPFLVWHWVHSWVYNIMYPSMVDSRDQCEMLISWDTLNNGLLHSRNFTWGLSRNSWVFLDDSLVFSHEKMGFLAGVLTISSNQAGMWWYGPLSIVLCGFPRGMRSL